jgi:integrase
MRAPVLHTLATRDMWHDVVRHRSGFGVLKWSTVRNSSLSSRLRVNIREQSGAFLLVFWNQIAALLHPLLESLGIPQGGMHGFRHGRVSFLVENNTPVEVIKVWIGHGSERMVRRYTHLRPMYRSRVLAAIPSLIGCKIDVFDPLTPIFDEEKVA